MIYKHIRMPLWFWCIFGGFFLGSSVGCAVREDAIGVVFGAVMGVLNVWLAGVERRLQRDEAQRQISPGRYTEYTERFADRLAEEPSATSIRKSEEGVQ